MIIDDIKIDLKIYYNSNLNKDYETYTVDWYKIYSATFSYKAHQSVNYHINLSIQSLIHPLIHYIMGILKLNMHA